ncbi:MAG: DUF2857 domain-containing protein [Gammaproteobacteria bacterium]|nr:DUF2857 domain-containing protein [Gammaproteobacteria bacterium]MDE0411064.1 DUF2857 domain-containing protein [Gammaproteobacteria bacterium]
MNATREADLVSAVLMYAIRCLAECDWVALRNMKFGPKEIDALRGMSVADLYRIESLRGHCLDITLDRLAFWQMIEHLHSQRESEEALQSLIAADAPQEMVEVLFGLKPRVYSRLRRNLSVEPSVGRPAELDEESANLLWEVWSRWVDGGEGEPTPKAYLDIHQETGIAMRAIWSLTQRWSMYGHLSGRPRKESTQTDGDG